MADQQILIDIKVITDKLVNAKKNIDDAKKAIKDLGDQLKAGKITQSEYNNEVAKQNDVVKENTKAAEKTAREIRNNVNYQKLLTEATSEATLSLSQMEKQLDKLNNLPKDGLSADQIDNLTEAILELEEKIQGAKEDLNNFNVGEAFGDLNNDLGEISALIDGVDNSLSALGVNIPEIEKIKKAFNDFATITKTVGLALEFATAAKYKNIVASVKNAVVTAAESIAFLVLGKSADVASVAFKMLRAALISTGIGALIVGVGMLVSGLVSFFSSTKKAEQAQKAYNVAMEEGNNVIKEVDDKLSLHTNKIKNAYRKQIQDLKAKGATEEEIANAQINMQEEIIESEKNAAKEKITQYDAQINATEELIKSVEKEKKSSDKRDERLKELRNNLKEYNNELERQKNLVESLDLDSADNKAKSQEEKDDIAIKRLGLQQKAAEARIKAEKGYQSEDYEIKRGYEQRLFELQQSGEKQRLNAMQAANKITADEYKNQMAIINAASTEFKHKQEANDKKYIDDVKKQIMMLAGEEAKVQIDNINKEYEESIKNMEKIRKLDSEKAANDFINNNDTIKKMEAERQKRIDEVNKQLSEKAMSERLEMLEKEAKEQFKAFENNEMAKLKLQKDIYLKAKAEMKSGEDTSEIDAKIAEADAKIKETDYKRQLAIVKYATDAYKQIYEIEKKNLEDKIATFQEGTLEYAEAMNQMKELNNKFRQDELASIEKDTNTKVAFAKLEGKSTYEIRKEGLEKQKAELEKSGKAQTAEYANVIQQMNDLDKEHRQAQIDKWVGYANTVKEALSGIFELMNTLGEAEVKRAEEESAAKKESLKAQLEAGAISQQEYNKEVENSDKQLEKKKAELARKQAIRDKATKAFEIGINTSSAIMRAWSDSGPFGGPIFSAIIGAMGALQLATVMAAPLPKAAKGGLIQGKSHAQGGVMLEAEGGEYIINRKATALNMPLLEALNNSSLNRFNDGGFTYREYQRRQPLTVDYDRLAAVVVDGVRKSNIYVAVEDIAEMENKVSYTDNRIDY